MILCETPHLIHSIQNLLELKNYILNWPVKSSVWTVIVRLHIGHQKVAYVDQSVVHKESVSSAQCL